MSTRTQKAISVSLPQTLLDDIDRRASFLGLSRNTYLSLLAQQDLTQSTPPILRACPLTTQTNSQL